MNTYETKEELPAQKGGFGLGFFSVAMEFESFDS